MKRFLLLTGAVLLLLLVSFLVAEHVGIAPLFAIPRWMETPSLAAALVGVCLLIADVLLPVPSSLIMIAHGAIFGFWLGTLLSLIGQVGAALLGFGIGRVNSTRVARFVSATPMAQTQVLLRRWGMVAIIVTRPIPLLAETTAIMAGAAKLNLAQVLVASLAGGLPTAALYALTGTLALGLDSTLWSFALVLLVASLFWLLREPVDRLLFHTPGDPISSVEDTYEELFIRLE
jgi:uncharacterized membrane protein YdjX (TVP38/TMEM64 family)